MGDGGFAQLYYTSCERGLRGTPGFQFNAATAGVAPDVLRDVEVMTGYEPPRTVPFDADAAALARCPVNLCHRPGPDTVLARVVFVGTDYSKRFGNYFAHAIVAPAAGFDLGRLLPIELWDAPFWHRDESSTPELPTLAAPPPRGPLDAAAVDAFVAGEGARTRLAMLLTAVERAVLHRERKVVIVAHDSAETAHWIAAVSYLLPIRLARDMAFATYEHAPRYSRFDVVGTVPDADVDRADAAFEAQFLFDLTTDRCSEVPVHPLATTLAAAGVGGAAALWADARDLATGTEVSFDDWQPVVTAAALLGGRRLPIDPAALPAWIAERATDLGRPAVERIGAAVADTLTGQAAVDGLPLLAEAARAAGATGLLQRVLHRADPAPAATIALLAWADRTDTPVDDGRLHTAGLTAVGPGLLRDVDDETLVAMVRRWPSLRDGVVVHLGEEARRAPERVLDAWLAGLGDVVGRPSSAAAALTPVLAEIVDITSARTGALPATAALGRIAEGRAEAGRDLDAALLHRLWPDGSWTAHEAVQVLDVVEPALAVAEPVVQWLDAVLRAGATESGARGEASYDSLCQVVREHPVYDTLPRDTRTVVDAQIDAANLIDALVAHEPRERFRTTVDELTRLSRGRGRAATALRGRFVERYRELGPGRLSTVLLCSPQLRAGVLGAADPALHPAAADPEVAAELLAVVWALAPRSDEADVRRVQREVGDTVTGRLRRWRRRDLDLVAQLLAEGSGKEATAWFSGWRRQNAGNPMIRFVRTSFSALVTPHPPGVGGRERGESR